MVVRREFRAPCWCPNIFGHKMITSGRILMFHVSIEPYWSAQDTEYLKMVPLPSWWQKLDLNELNHRPNLVYLWYFFAYIWCIFGIPLAYLWYIFGIYLAYIWCIFGTSLGYLWYINGIFLVYLSCIFWIYMVYLWHIFVIYLAYCWHIFVVS